VFQYGDVAGGERIIDSQYATCTKYVSTTMRGDETMFGVNFADGRIKGYPVRRPGGRGETRFYALYVRGNPDYGKNQFDDSGDGTITDRATGLTWMKQDSGHLKAGKNRDGKLNWQEALAWAEGLEYAGHSDWRLPSIKELQSIVDYTRSPDTSSSAAIDPIFDVSSITDEDGVQDYPFYWSNTTHKRLHDGGAGAYIAFGESPGWMRDFGGQYRFLDVHGAGSQRSDPKAGDPSRFPRGFGPQGDVIRIYNHARAVRGGEASPKTIGPKVETTTAKPGPRGRSASPGLAIRPGPKMRPGQAPGQRSGPPNPARFILRLDHDGDGKVSRNEFDGPPNRFRFLDRNKDGYLSENELLEASGAGTPEERPQQLRGQGASANPSPGGRPSEADAAPSEPPWAEIGGENVRADAAWHNLPPSFVFILVDDMGWTGLSVPADDGVPESMSDFYQTPRIAELALQGMRFTDAYAPSPMCTPSRASLLTGKSPAQLRMTTPGPSDGQPADRKMIPPRHVDALPAEETTVAEVLQRYGYATAHLGKWHLYGGGPGCHGFDRHDGETGNDGPGEYDDPNPKDIFGITRRAISFMERQVLACKPFYLQLSHYAVHEPTKALVASKAACAEMPGGARHHRVDYAAMSRDLDTGVGMVLDRIDSLGIAANTYVVFMSDNGAASRPGYAENHPLSGGKATLWEGGIRVPLMIRGPGVKPGGFCRQRVVGHDLFPTFCQLAHVSSALPETVEGMSLVPLLLEEAGQTAFRRDQQEIVFHFPHYAKGPRQTPQSAILSGNFKLIRFYETGEERLFDLAQDIGEQHDLGPQMPERAAALAARLDAHLVRIAAQMPTPNPDYDPTDVTPAAGRRREAALDRPQAGSRQ